MPRSALTCGFAAVVGERGDAGEGGDGMTVEGAELGEIDQQVGGDAGPHARNRKQDLVAPCQGRVGSDPRGDLGFQALDMALEALETPSELFPEEGGLACGEAVGQGRALGGCGIARMHQLLQPSIASGAGGLACGPIAWPNMASILASTRSVLASVPVARANSSA